jgi:integrase
MSAMKLTFTKIEALKARNKVYRVNDGRGLCLEVRTNGSKIWRFRFKKIDGKYSMISLGQYPEVSLSEVRDIAAEKRKLIAHGKPIITKGTDFKSIFNEWHKKNLHIWTEKHASQIFQRMNTYVLPWLGKRPVQEITGPELLMAMRRIEKRGYLELAHRTLQICNKVFLYAVASGFAERNPAMDIQGALPPPKKRNWPAPKDPKQVAALLKSIDEYRGSFVTVSALNLHILTFVRPGELRQAEWAEIDFEEILWRIPAKKTKKKRDHLVPLSRQALDVLEEIRPLTGTSKYIFPSERSKDRAMSDNCLNAALRRMGYTKDEIVAHGFRHMASTLLHEQGWQSHVIEKQLAHTDSNKIRGVYNKAEYLNERIRLMQGWADYLDGLKKGDKVKAVKTVV